MKFLNLSLLAALALAALSVPAHAVQRGSPFEPYIDQRFSDLEDDQVAGSYIARKYARAVYNVAVDGGGSTSHDLNVTLPADAVITGLYVYTNTAFTAGGGGGGKASVALQCYGTRDLMAYRDLSLVPVGYAIAANFTGSPVFSTAGSVIGFGLPAAIQVPSVPTACALKAIVRGDNGFETLSAGKFTAIVEYFSR